MNTITVIEYNNIKIRGVVLKNKPYLFATDISKSLLGYSSTYWTKGRKGYLVLKGKDLRTIEGLSKKTKELTVVSLAQLKSNPSNFITPQFISYTRTEFFENESPLEISKTQGKLPVRILDFKGVIIRSIIYNNNPYVLTVDVTKALKFDRVYRLDNPVKLPMEDCYKYENLRANCGGIKLASKADLLRILSGHPSYQDTKEFMSLMEEEVFNVPTGIKNHTFEGKCNISTSQQSIGIHHYKEDIVREIFFNNVSYLPLQDLVQVLGYHSERIAKKYCKPVTTITTKNNPYDSMYVSPEGLKVCNYEDISKLVYNAPISSSTRTEFWDWYLMVVVGKTSLQIEDGLTKNYPDIVAEAVHTSDESVEGVLANTIKLVEVVLINKDKKIAELEDILLQKDKVLTGLSVTIKEMYDKLSNRVFIKT
jgi:prophage antirepressor-like protein